MFIQLKFYLCVSLGFSSPTFIIKIFYKVQLDCKMFSVAKRYAVFLITLTIQFIWSQWGMAVDIRFEKN